MDFKQYLIDKKAYIRLIDVKKRSLLAGPNESIITTIIGPRRAGKTYVIYDFIKREGLGEGDYLFINFEDEGIAALSREEIMKSVFYHQEAYGKAPEYLFLDEVQAFDNWQGIVYTFYERKQYKIVITGSSSKLLSKEIATQLRGRGIPTLVLPFSFAEKLALSGIKVKEPVDSMAASEIRHAAVEYLDNGGFPDIVLSNTSSGKFFREYLDVLIFKDIVEREHIRNIFAARYIMNAIASAYAKEFSVHKSYLALKGSGAKTSKRGIYNYAGYFEDAFFCFFVPKFDFSARKSHLSAKKVYLNDTGLAASFIRLGGETGRLMENLVFLELKRRQERSPGMEIYYWKDYDGREVDFIIKKGHKISQAIQVTYMTDMNDLDKRETESIVKAHKKLGCSEELIITWDREGSIKADGISIRLVPLWKWLLGIGA